MSGPSFQIATESALAQKHELLAEFKQRLETVLRWGLAHPDDYAVTWSKETGLPLDVSKKTLQVRGFDPASIDQNMIDDQGRTITLYVREHVLPGGQDAAAGFDRSSG